ncbi:phage holin [Streptococcus parauberis]|uniref:phage holin n=1 Tax=Streptococcus parauberis TaxID=1348 RepID=UPI00288E099D|nr:phage holin [Streptococcus parauberis]MDT2748893.1 phage holin [Streptococcus parauberis]
MEQLQQVITSASMTVITILLGMAAKWLKEYLLKKGGEKAVIIAEILAKNAVNAVEQIALDKNIHGYGKLEVAKKKMVSELEKHNIYLTDKDLETYIEAAVKTMNDNWKEVKNDSKY